METNNDTILIGQRIRAARQAKGMSQADLAFDADISLPHISNFELGKKQLSIGTRFADAFALSITFSSSSVLCSMVFIKLAFAEPKETETYFSARVL